MDEETKKMIYRCASMSLKEGWGDEKLISFFKITINTLEEWRKNPIWQTAMSFSKGEKFVHKEEDVEELTESKEEDEEEEVLEIEENDSEENKLIKAIDAEVLSSERIAKEIKENKKKTKSTYKDDLEEYQYRVSNLADDFLTLMERSSSNLLEITSRLSLANLDVFQKIEIEQRLQNIYKNMAGAAKTSLEFKDAAMQVSDLKEQLDKIQGND